MLACSNALRAGYLVCPSCWRAAPRHLKTTFTLAARRKNNAALVAAADQILAALNEAASPLA